MGAFETLASVDVGEHIEKKEGLSYLTWSWAWDEVKKRFPEASYSIWKSESGLPYVYDELTGFMVYTSVTIEGITHEMWLPVMDNKNKAMKAIPYEYEAKEWQNGKKVAVLKKVQPATMFDINKTIMRCLVKNLAMFGLGLYIYSGEDLPRVEEEDQPKNPIKAEKPKEEKASAKDDQTRAVEEAKAKARVIGYINRHQMPADDIERICKFYKVKSINDLSLECCNHYIESIGKRGGSIDE